VRVLCRGLTVLAGMCSGDREQLQNGLLGKRGKDGDSDVQNSISYCHEGGAMISRLSRMTLELMK